MEMSIPVTGSKTERWEHDREMFGIMNHVQKQMRHLIFLNSRRVHRDFSSDLCFSKTYFRGYRDLKAEWGEEQQVLSGGQTPREERCSWSNEHRSLWKGQDPPTSTEFLVNINAILKRKNPLASQHLVFSCSCCTLLLLQGGIWKSQALAHTAAVYNNSSAARWCHKSLHLKMGR